jgi:hypothetical protein
MQYLTVIRGPWQENIIPLWVLAQTLSNAELQGIAMTKICHGYLKVMPSPGMG